MSETTGRGFFSYFENYLLEFSTFPYLREFLQTQTHCLRQSSLFSLAICPCLLAADKIYYNCMFYLFKLYSPNLQGDLCPELILAIPPWFELESRRRIQRASDLLTHSVYIFSLKKRRLMQLSTIFIFIKVSLRNKVS